MELIVIGLVVGLATGILSGLVGIGGGILLVPALLYIFKVNMHSATGTSLAIIIPTAVVGAYSHFVKGSVEWGLAGFLAAGAIAGSFLGTKLSYMLSAASLKKVFAVVLLIASVTILLDAYGISLTGQSPKPSTVAAEAQAEVAAAKQQRSP